MLRADAKVASAQQTVYHSVDGVPKPLRVALGVSGIIAVTPGINTQLTNGLWRAGVARALARQAASPGQRATVPTYHQVNRWILCNQETWGGQLDHLLTLLALAGGLPGGSATPADLDVVQRFADEVTADLTRLISVCHLTAKRALARPRAACRVPPLETGPFPEKCVQCLRAKRLARTAVGDVAVLMLCRACVRESWPRTGGRGPFVV